MIMKKMMLFALMISSLTGFSQGYVKLLNESFYWDIPFAAQAYICSGFADYGPWRYKISGDTVINNKTWSKIYRSNFQNVNPTPPNCPPFIVDTVFSLITECFLREDTVAQKVWRYDNFGGGGEVLLYDFTLQKGDTLEIRNWGLDWVIDTVMTITTYDGIERRKFVYYGDDGSIFPREGWYIEGIGGMAGLFGDPFPYFEVGTWLMCVKDRNDNNIWYSQFSYCYDFITDVPAIQNELTIDIFPNPFTNHLTIETFTGIVEVKIYNMFGNEVVREEIYRSKVLDMSSLKPGIYILKIVNDNNVMMTKRIIKAQDL